MNDHNFHGCPHECDHVDHQRLKEQMHETTVSQFNIAENVADLYKEKQVEKDDENIIQKKIY